MDLPTVIIYSSVLDSPQLEEGGVHVAATIILRGPHR